MEEDTASMAVQDLEPDRVSQMSQQPVLGEEEVVIEGMLFAKVKTPAAIGHRRKWVGRHHVLTESGMEHTFSGCLFVLFGRRL